MWLLVDAKSAGENAWAIPLDKAAEHIHEFSHPRMSLTVTGDSVEGLILQQALG